MPCNLAKIEVLDRGFLIDPGGYTTLPACISAAHLRVSSEVPGLGSVGFEGFEGSVGKTRPVPPQGASG